MGILQKYFKRASFQGQEMKRFGERDTRFPGAQKMLEHPEHDHVVEDAEKVHFHNWFNEIFQGITVLASLSKCLSRKQKYPS